MSKKILITYATRAGSTAGVAEAIRKNLLENGADVDLQPMQNVKDLTPYNAVIAGSAIQNRQWLPEAMDFIQMHQTALRKKPVALFSVCMTLTMRNSEKYRPSIAEWVSPVRGLVHPISEGLFAGALDIRKIPSMSDRLKIRLSVALGVWAEGDHRDWKAIRTWTNAFFAQLSLMP